ncbi:MAG: hypothetical protein AAGA44_15995 [Pseudomonadota bacterium]
MEIQLRPIVLLVIGVIGILALIAIEIMRGMVGDAAAEMLVPLIVMICVASSPVLLLTLVDARWAYWLSLIVAGLLSLFHALHVAEHAIANDFGLLALIVVTMLIPSVSATALLWRGRDAGAPASSPQPVA